MKYSIGITSTILTSAILFACSDSSTSLNDSKSSTTVSSTTTISSAIAPSSSATVSSTTNHRAFLKNYSDIALQVYKESYDKAVLLQTAINSFLTSPTEETLQAAKEAWLASREPYGATETFRFYNGPIDNEKDGPEGQLNAWPLDEGFIDYIAGDESAKNLINNEDFSITAEALKGKNEEGGEANISTGYHSIEFLLWGQDLNDASKTGKDVYITSEGKTISGNRPLTDYTEGTLKDRRALYLKTITNILVSDLKSLVDAWTAGSENYRKSFEAETSTEGLRRALLGMASLSKVELSGERMAVALENHDQEDEHSCFSDNTHRDMIQGNLGIYSLFTGTYGKTSGKGLKDLLSPELLKEATSVFEDTKKKVEAIQAPFDWEIAKDNTEGNARIQAAITALRVQGALLEKIAPAVGVTNLQIEE